MTYGYARLHLKLEAKTHQQVHDIKKASCYFPFRNNQFPGLGLVESVV